MFEEIVVPCFGRHLELEVLPAIHRALFKKELEPLAEIVRGTKVDEAALQAKIEGGYQEIRNHVLHGQIDYVGSGPLPEHWKQYIDREANYYDWRHPRWAIDAEALLANLAIKAAYVPGWDPAFRPAQRTGDGMVDLLYEVKDNSAAAARFVDKYLEGLPEWLQHDNAFTGGYLSEEDCVNFRAILEGERAKLEGALKTKALFPSWMGFLERAKSAKIGISWTII